MATDTGTRAPWKVALKWFLLAFLGSMVVGLGLSFAILPEHFNPEQRGEWVGRWILFPAMLAALLGYFVQEGRNRKAARSPVTRHTKTAPTDVFRPDA